MTRTKIILAMLAAAVIVPTASDAAEPSDVMPASQYQNSWYTDADDLVQDRINNPQSGTSAKNVILFVGDGMGVSTLTAARIYQGQKNGNDGEEDFLFFENFDYAALIKTYNTNQQTPDSAGTMTAMMTGVKTKAGVIGYGPTTLRGDCDSAQGKELTTALMQAEAAGMATGVVTTARLTHATPAAAYARSPERNWEDDDDLPEGVTACTDIAAQLVDFDIGDGIEVAMGGGRRHFMPNQVQDPEDAGNYGNRTDGRFLTAEWEAKGGDWTYVWNKDQFDAITDSTQHLLGLFERSHMEYEADRADDSGGEPSLAEMTAKAIDILEEDDDGFLLIVESGRIDHAHHAGNAQRALEDTLAFAAAVEAADDLTDDGDTLILVTADHGHVMTMAGYPERGNPILGLVAAGGSNQLGADNLPYTTLGYANGPGSGNIGDSPWTAGRTDLSSVDTEALDYRQESLIPLGSETHSGEDISLHADGIGSWLVHGTLEQNVVYHVMNLVLGLNP